MDINTTYSIQKDRLPERYRNQIDQTLSIQENYISGKERAYSEVVAEPAEETVINIETTYQEI